MNFLILFSITLLYILSYLGFGLRKLISFELDEIRFKIELSIAFLIFLFTIFIYYLFGFLPSILIGISLPLYFFSILKFQKISPFILFFLFLASSLILGVRNEIEYLFLPAFLLLLGRVLYKEKIKDEIVNFLILILILGILFLF